MSTAELSSPSPPGRTAPPAGPTGRRGRWLDRWDPEDEVFWRSTGRVVARRNLLLSVLTEFLGFSVWAVWSVVVPQLSAAGFSITVDQQFWLIALPSLVGACLRIPYSLAIGVFGGRNWTVVSALLLLVPTVAMTFALSEPSTSFASLLLIAALAGLGGGNFASSMANISFFYPEREKGRALGLNAAGGNLGTAAVQFAVPLVIGTGAALALERAGLLLIPFIVVAAVLAWRLMDNLVAARSDPRAFLIAARYRHTWVLSVLYFGTFGSFIGFSGVFPTLLRNQFPTITLTIAFLGALVGSLARPLGGILADRFGGAAVSIWSFATMAAGTIGAIAALRAQHFAGFFAAFLVLFVASGVGNGSIYRMIPAVFRATGGLDRAAQLRAAAGCIGIAGAVGALGGFGIPRVFAASTSATGSLEPALWLFVGVYLLMASATWAVYQRRGAALSAARI